MMVYIIISLFVNICITYFTVKTLRLSIRAQTLVLAVVKLRKDFSVSHQPEDDANLPYFVIHPVLKHIAIINNINRT